MDRFTKDVAHPAEAIPQGGRADEFPAEGIDSGGPRCGRCGARTGHLLGCPDLGERLVPRIAAEAAAAPVRGSHRVCLDLGAGKISPPGFTPLGRPWGSAIYPLPYADGEVAEIRASHCLEHFPHAEVPAVLREWVRALVPGGRLRIAVPDFAQVARRYLAGEPQPTEGYVVGGQTEPDDFHKAIFDAPHLKRLMSEAGLTLLRPWQSEIVDGAAMPISLNLEGYKPVLPMNSKVSAVMSVPRLGFMDHFFTAFDALPKLGIKLRRSMGAFWGQCLTYGIEQILAEDTPDLILALDYDTIFRAADVATLIQLMLIHPHVDALAAVQSSRHVESALFSVRGQDGKNVSLIERSALAADLLRASTAHFGLTLIRADAVRRLPKPWFHATPDPSGAWGEGRVDEDIAFWRGWEAAGNSLYLAPRVVVGHMELMVRWPGAADLKAIYQPISEWRADGAPKGAWR